MILPVRQGYPKEGTRTQSVEYGLEPGREGPRPALREVGTVKLTGGPLYLLILAVCVLLVVSQVLLKVALQRVGSQHPAGATLVLTLFTRPSFWLACVATASAAVLWLLVIRSAPLSQVYPMISLSYVLMIPAARLIFGEAVTVQRVAGALIIVVGVAVLSRSL